jgi:hypothetical protein
MECKIIIATFSTKMEGFWNIMIIKFMPIAIAIVWSELGRTFN